MRVKMRGLLLGLLLAAPAAHAVPAAPVRVGIVAGADSVEVGVAGTSLLLTADGEALGRRPRTAPLRFGVREAAAPSAPHAKPQWNVRIAVEPTRRKADLVREALDEDLRAPLRVEKSGSAFAVLAGPFDEEPRARALLAELADVGMDEAVLLKPEAPAPSPSASRLVVVTGGWDVVSIPGERARVASPDGRPIAVDGKEYRGEIEVLVGASGSLVVVNEVGLEEYLRGVVPSELGPEAYPALAALEAQAIAARTYALMPPAHAAEGFDRCAGPHCQVYGGVGAEHPLSDQAVENTSSLVLAHEGRAIHAYFSSTCGGRTEAVENVFADEPAPYLRGVPCYPERVEFLRIPGRQIATDFSRVDGRTAHGVLARLVASGIVTDDEAKAGVFSRKARSEEAAIWLARAAQLAGRTLDRRAMSSLSADTALAFVRSVLDATGASGQARLVAPQDLAAASRFREMQGLSGDDLTTALLGLKAGLLPEGLEPGWAQVKLSRGNVLEIVESWLRAQGKLDPVPVRFVAAREGALEVLAGKERKLVTVAPGVMLLSGRAASPKRLRDAVELKLGDKLRLYPDDGAARVIEVDEDPDGASMDRTSAYSWWTRRLTLEQLAKNAATAGVKDLRDVRVTRVSEAGRVVGLELVDAAGQATPLERFACRQFLGLPDSRCELRLERDLEDRLVAVTATGRGWGHGVGLCQTGAFGMALQGRRMEEILVHYYPGVEILPLSRVRAAETPAAR